MANNVIGQLAFLRNKNLFKSKKEAKEGLTRAAKKYTQDGSLILARYADDVEDEIKTLVGVVYSNNGLRAVTVFESDEIIIDGQSDDKIDEIDDSPYGKKYKNYLKELSKISANIQ